MPAVRKALGTLTELELSLWSEEAGPSVLVDAGGRVYVRRPGGEVQSPDGARPLDPDLLDLIEPFSTREGTEGPHLQAPRPHVRIVPGKLSGSPHVLKTRVETIALAALDGRGLDADQIHTLYPMISPVAIGDALDFERQLQTNLRAAA
jgi:uncharacterized protein (DUF433 family)